MTNRVAECGGQGWIGVCGTAASEPADRVFGSSGYRALGAPQRALADAILDAQGGDRGLCDGLYELVGTRGFRTLDADDQQRVLLALADRPTGEAADRLRHLAADPSFRAFPTDEQAEHAAAGRLVSARQFFRASGAEAPPRHGAGLGPVGAGLHALESVAEGLHVAEGAAAAAGAHVAAEGTAAAFATAAAAGGLVLLAFEMAHGLHEAHVDAVVLNERITFGQGFGGKIADLLGEPAYRPPNAAAAEGARVAGLVWDALEPSERATLLALPAEGRTDLTAELTQRLVRRTIAGR